MNSFIRCLVLLGFVLGAVGRAEGSKLTEYSADQVTKNAKGAVISSSKVYVAPHKMRVEQMGVDRKSKSIVIIRLDQKLMRILMTEQNTYMETALNEAALQKTLKSIPIDAEEEVLGTETVNGYACTKKRVETKVRGPFGMIRSSSTVWVSDQMDLPLRTQQKNGETTELTNIQPGRQPAELFEVPSGYEKMPNPLEALGQMFDRGGTAK